MSSLSSTLSPGLSTIEQSTSPASIDRSSFKPLSTQAKPLSLTDPSLNYDLYDETVEKSLLDPDFFDVKKLVSVRDMFNARVYLGHKEGTLNPHMKPYLFGSRLGHLIIDLDQTAVLLKDALNFAAHIAFRNGIILFMNKSATTGHIVERTAVNCGEYSHCRDWKIGTFTDSVRYYGAVTRLPDLMIFLNTTNNIFEQHFAVREAAKFMIPTIGVVDTNCDPCIVTYPVPGNDDSVQSIEYFCSIFEAAIKAGKAKREQCLHTPLIQPEEELLQEKKDDHDHLS